MYVLRVSSKPKPERTEGGTRVVTISPGQKISGLTYKGNRPRVLWLDEAILWGWGPWTTAVLVPALADDYTVVFDTMDTMDMLKPPPKEATAACGLGCIP